MIKFAGAVFAGLAIAVGGCATQGDVLATSDAGYVEGAATIAASTDWSQSEVVVISLSKYAFSPAELQFHRSRPYRLVLRNTGKATHYFVSEDFFKAIAARTLITSSGRAEGPLLRSVAVPSGEQKEIIFVPVKAGVYRLECTAPLDALLGMKGTIQIY